jgi:undecaprenyl-diphosphatase
MEALIELDKKLFFFFNGLHTPWLDPVMVVISNTWAWLPLYIFLLYVLLNHYKKKTAIIIVALTLTIFLADQFTSTVMKPYFARFRPSRDPALREMVHIVGNHRGGKYGFASSHAANTFGVATFLFLALRNSKKWIPWIFLWSVIVTYSSIYLGVHYPGDVLVGGIVGALFGCMIFYLTSKVLSLKFKPKA